MKNRVVDFNLAEFIKMYFFPTINIFLYFDSFKFSDAISILIFKIRKIKEKRWDFNFLFYIYLFRFKFRLWFNFW